MALRGGRKRRGVSSRTAVGPRSTDLVVGSRSRFMARAHLFLGHGFVSPLLRWGGGSAFGEAGGRGLGAMSSHPPPPTPPPPRTHPPKELDASQLQPALECSHLSVGAPCTMRTAVDELDVLLAWWSAKLLGCRILCVHLSCFCPSSTWMCLWNSVGSSALVSASLGLLSVGKCFAYRIPPSSAGHWYLYMGRTAMCLVLGSKFWSC
jgi:hypothetical protein